MYLERNISQPISKQTLNKSLLSFSNVKPENGITNGQSSFRNGRNNNINKRDTDNSNSPVRQDFLPPISPKNLNSERTESKESEESKKFEKYRNHIINTRKKKSDIF